MLVFSNMWGFQAGLKFGLGMLQIKRSSCTSADWVENRLRQPWGEGLGALGRWEAQHDNQCALTAQKASSVLGCIKNSMASWAREGILPPYSAFAVPNSRTWTCWRKSRGGHNEEQRAGWPLLCRQAETIWFIQSGEEKATGRTLEHLLVPKGDLRESLRGTLLRAWSDKRSGNIFKLKSLDLVLRRYFCPVRVVRHWSRWPREVGGAPPLEVLKRRLNGALNNLI